MNKNKFKIAALLAFFCCAMFNIIGCSGQINQKENTTPPLNQKTENIKNEKPSDDPNLNQFLNNEKEGLWKTYHINGQLKSEGHYKAGLKEGLHKEWEDNGILMVEGLYANGKANGLMKWFHEKGHLAGSGNMIDDVREGKWTICDIEENGFCINANFKNGKRHGIWVIHHQHAPDKVWKEQSFKDDKMVSERCWDDQGKEITCE